MRIPPAVSMLAALLIHSGASGAPVPREGPISGRIVERKQGETAVLVPTPQQRPAEINQNLKAGDVLRTNAAGTLAVVFADRTQIRLGRNSTLLVKQVRQGVPSAVSLRNGSLWARSPRGASQLSVETPSATAAIRGTEYSIVAEDERTTLTVVEGTVNFFNEQGEVLVREGESAAARLGQAPTKIFIVNAASREQMLYYLGLDEALSFLRPSPVPQLAARRSVAKVKSIDPPQRTVEDWVQLAEAGAEVEPRTTIVEALAQARKGGLTREQLARVQLVEASNAMADRSYAVALSLFQAALPNLAGRQREVARYGSFIAKTLTDPSAAGELPTLNEAEPVSYVGQAFLHGYLGEFAEARRIAAEGLRKFSDESALYAMLGGIGLLSGDEKAMADASRQALLLDPEDAFATRLQAELELKYRGNPQAAIASAERAVKLAPADDNNWNVLSEARSGWEQSRKAEQAILAGLAESPNSVFLRVNYALALLQQGRLQAAKRELAAARAIIPENGLVQLAEGYIALREGRKKDAFEAGLASSAINPSYSQALLLLAELYYADGEADLALQQIDAADRADPNNPFVALYRAAFAIDSYRADDAIAAARDALRRYQARGGIYASLSESKGTGSFIAGAFRLLNLDEWARYYGDRAFDPFVPAALFDRALSAAPNPYLFRQDYQPYNSQLAGRATIISDVLQGIRLDPLTITGSEKELQLNRQKFTELQITPSVVLTDGRVTFSQGGALNGIEVAPVPFAYSITASRDRLELPVGKNNDRVAKAIQAVVGVKLTPYDNLVMTAGRQRQIQDLTGTIQSPRDNGFVRDKAGAVYALYAHEFDRENVLSLAGGYFTSDRAVRRADATVLRVDPTFILNSDYRDGTRTKGWLVSANYALGLGRVELQAGGEFYSAKIRQTTFTAISLPPLLEDSQSTRETVKVDEYRPYVDIRFLASDRLILQGQAALSGISVDGVSKNKADIRVGAAFEPARGHWLRAAYVSAHSLALPFTLAPTAMVGVRPAEAPVPNGLKTESLVARWEAEWGLHVFSSVEYQHQDFAGLSFERANFVDRIDPSALSLPLGIRSVDVGRASLDRISTNLSFWLSGNVGVQTTYAYTRSDVKDPIAEPRLPFVSRHFGRAQITWTNGNRLKLSGGVSYVGSRLIAENGTKVGAAWLGDMQLLWEPHDKRVQVTVGLFNVLNERVIINPGVPSFGRTFAASVDFRF